MCMRGVALQGGEFYGEPPYFLRVAMEYSMAWRGTGVMGGDSNTAPLLSTPHEDVIYF